MRPEHTDALRITATGSRTTVFAYGDPTKPAILAVHGFRGTHYGLEPVAHALTHLGYQVLVPDLPGAGESSPLLSRHDTVGYGTWLRDLAAQLPQVRLLLGHSFGSVIVASAIAQGAQHDGAVLVNPILRSPLAGPRRLATAATRAYFALARRLPRPLAHQLLASKLIACIGGTLMTSTTDPTLRRWIRDEHLRQAGAFASRDVVLESFAASTATTITDFAHHFTAPTLLIGGDRDPLSPSWACTAEATGIGSGTFHILADRGHLLPYEEVAEVSRLVAEWDERSADRDFVA
ncbi:alpha/beta fold hydrolase [Microbacterium murale]|uniref:Alpha-beta hydrolase superfamily lysophospholipase n=1 Tax=Microbacterium murale TaxID=1081040 RepID=A0ABU0PDE4_9MICO|nr:alpha/beta fold hydrolase [Microbacterium murale]MDQ0645349.1 alpha-beta hydrolase superfamily lysophospholipase [Microbacterium murale]